MLKASLSLLIDDATTFATVYQGDKPVASVQRKRMFGESDRKTWTVYDLNGVELFQTNLGAVTIRSRVASILKAREAAADPVEVARENLKVAENAMHHGRRINAEDVKAREDAYSAAVDHLDQALAARSAPKVDRMTPAAAFAEVRRIRDELTALAGKLDHLDHDIARDLNAARDDLFGAWSKLREAQKEAA